MCMKVFEYSFSWIGSWLGRFYSTYFPINFNDLSLLILYLVKLWVAWSESGTANLTMVRSWLIYGINSFFCSLFVNFCTCVLYLFIVMGVLSCSVKLVVLWLRLQRRCWRSEVPIYTSVNYLGYYNVKSHTPRLDSICFHWRPFGQRSPEIESGFGIQFLSTSIYTW